MAYPFLLSGAQTLESTHIEHWRSEAQGELGSVGQGPVDTAAHEVASASCDLAWWLCRKPATLQPWLGFPARLHRSRFLPHLELLSLELWKVSPFSSFGALSSSSLRE